MLSFLRGGNRRTKTIWWVLIFVTVVTFLGGFVFLLGSGLDSSNRARMSGAIGTVNGNAVSRTEYQIAVSEQREAYLRQNGYEPGGRNMRAVELQAWRSLVMQHLLNDQAKKLGLDVNDHEVVVSLRTNPPPSILAAPTFQTNGQFDYNKYQAALNDPGNVHEVAGLEALTRRQLPMRKLQERLLASVKLSEPELLEAYHQRFDRVTATVVIVPPLDGEMPVPTEADLQKIHEKYKTRFSFPARTQVEVLRAPKVHGEEEIRAAREMANSLVHRVRAGESFATLARDYSEGSEAERGGEIDRVLSPAELGSDLAPKLAVMDTGTVTDPVQAGGAFRIFKLTGREPHPQGGPGYRIAQIVVEVNGNEEKIREQHQSLLQVRKQAAKIGLGKAAAMKGLSTMTTPFFDAENTPPELLGVPEAAEWGIGGKEGDVSPVFEGNDEFAIVQVTAQRQAGPAKLDDIRDHIRQLAEFDARVERNKPKADAIAAALKAGMSIEQAAAAAGLAAATIMDITRLQQDPRLASAPELVGALFAARPGQVVGPLRLPNAWFFARLDDKSVADETLYQQVKSQFSAEFLQQRQRNFLNSYLTMVRSQAKVKDLRNDPNL